MVRIALLNFLFFFIGLGVGALFWSRPAGLAAAPEIVPAPAEGPAPGAGRKADPPAPLIPKSAEQGLSELLAALPAENIEGGTGTITGRILTADGEPLAGATVRAERILERGGARRGRGEAAPQDPSLEDVVLEVVASHRFRQATRREVCTDAKGTFAIEGLADARHRVSAQAEGYAFSSKGRTDQVEPGAEIEFTAEPVFDIACAVVLPGGGQPKEAMIVTQNAYGEQRSWTGVWTPDDPIVRIRVGAGAFKVRASCEADGEEYRSDAVDVTVEPGRQPPAVTLQLKGRPGVKGKVLFPKDEESDQAQVRLMRLAPGAAPDLERLGREGNIAWVHSHNKFSYAFRDLAPGTYAVGVQRGYQGPAVAAETVEVADHMVVRNLTVPAIDPADYLVIWVYGPKDEIIRNASISTSRRSKNQSSSGGGTVVKCKDGSYWLLRSPVADGAGSPGDDEEEDLHFFVSILTEAYGEKAVEYLPGQTEPVVVRFADPATLDVTIVNYAGSGYEGSLMLTLQRAAPEERQGGTRTAWRAQPYAPVGPGRKGLSPEGSQTFGPVEPGSYDVVLSIKSAQSSFRPVERVPVTLKAGPNAAEIAIPELHSVTIVVDDAPANATLSLRPVPRTADFRSDQRIGKDGKAEFTRLTPGEYRIQMYGTGRLEEMRVTIPGDREVRFAPKPLNALAVTVDDPAGYLAKVGFQSGDIIVGMEGKEFQNLMEVQAIFFGVQGTEDVQLKVLRGGQEVTVTFQPKKAMAADGSRALGGGFDAVSR